MAIETADNHGLEVISVDGRYTEGWTVFAGCEGDDPKFVAFFAKLEDAEFFAGLENDDGPVVFDAGITPAILTEHGLVCANDFDIQTHEQLRTRLQEAERAEAAEEQKRAKREAARSKPN